VSREPAPVILIVEDEGLIALELMEFLAGKGYRVPAPVQTGEEEIDRCGEDPRPDLVLMDVILAGRINGIEATRVIRGRYPVPVIMLTACNDDKTRAMLEELAPEGHLVKPFTREDLLDAISLVFDRTRAKIPAGLPENRPSIMEDNHDD